MIATAMRARIRARFAELYHEQQDKQTQLATLATSTPTATDTTLLDQLPAVGNVLPGLAPDIKARLFAAFDLQILWNKPGGQVTVHAEVTDATLRAVPALLNPGQDGYDDTADAGSGEAADVEDLFESPIVHQILPEARILPPDISDPDPTEGMRMASQTRDHAKHGRTGPDGRRAAVTQLPAARWGFAGGS